MRYWRTLTLIALVVGGAAWYFLYHPSASLAFIVTGSLVALGSTISDSKSDKFKITLALIGAAVAISGGVNGYQSGLRAQQDAKTSNDLLKTKTDELAAISKESRDLAKTNSELGRALIKRSDEITQLSRSAISEATGGDSFCYVDMGGMTGVDGLVANVERKGRYPLSNVDVTITDLDAFRQTLRTDKGLTLQNMDKWRRSFPTIDFLSRAGLWHPLANYPFPPDVQIRSFYVHIISRNGGFQEQLRVKRLTGGGWAVALVVTASYFDKRHGVVLERVDNNFPPDAFADDTDWHTLTKMKKLKIQY